MIFALGTAIGLSRDRPVVEGGQIFHRIHRALLRRLIRFRRQDVFRAHWYDRVTGDTGLADREFALQFLRQTFHATVSDAGQAGHACEAKQAGGEKRSATKT